LPGRARTGRSTSSGSPSAAAIPKAATPSFAYLGAPEPFGRYFVITASPSLQAEYVAELGEVATQPIFAEHNEAFRAGPAVTLALDGVKIDPVPWWIQRLHYEISYGWLYDFLSGRDYELLDTSLTFALDPKGHLGLTFSYRNGQLVETGQDVDLANIALSVSY
jgi:hypothetical protein